MLATKTSVRNSSLQSTPGIRPVFSVSGTKSRGKTAAPMFHETRAKDIYGNFDSSMFQAWLIWVLAAPYAPAGIPVRVDLNR